MNETPAEKLDQLKTEIRTLGQELENIVSIESIAMRLILKNILDIANQLSEPTFAEKIEESFKTFISTMKATANGNSAFFEVFTELASKKYNGLSSATYLKETLENHDSKKLLQIFLVFDNEQ